LNGVHDLGGMQDFGKVVREDNEPVFHADWERVVYAISRAMTNAGICNIDESRHSLERMDPADYLSSSYYQRWLDGRSKLLLEKGVLSEEEIAERQRYFEAHPEAPASAIARPPGHSAPPPMPANGEAYIRPANSAPAFAPGDAVVTRVTQPKGHTRLPRYARGKRGIVQLLHGTQVFPDTHAHGLGEQAQPLYSVRFDAAELWGDSAEPNQTVSIDLWESYLIPA
jgi:nitrile hydratase subunit beta